MPSRNIVHIEIPTRNSAESGEFYRDLFGWQITSIPEINYVMWEPGAPPAGGFSLLGDGVEAGDVIIYVDSPDITADLARAEALGGMIVHPKTEIANTGWFGMFKDPSGNVIALYTSKNLDFNR